MKIPAQDSLEQVLTAYVNTYSVPTTLEISSKLEFGDFSQASPTDSANDSIKKGT